MSDKKKVLRSDQAVVLGVSCVVAGFILGMVVGFLVSGTPTAPTGAPTTFAGPAGSAPPATLAPPTAALPNYSEQIRETKKILETDPNNRGAWVSLGNMNFDSGLYQDAVDAYSKALEINANDPNVTTDRGVMYRRLGQFDLAVQDFRNASQMDKTHIQSAYNLGLTLLHDLQDNKGALEAWEELLIRNPPPEMSAQVNQYLDALRNMVESGQ